MTEMMNAVSEWLKLILQVANLVIICYGLYKFLHKPQDTLSERVIALEKRQIENDLRFKEIKDSLNHGSDKFREQDETNAMFKSVILSFVDFEIAYCLHTNYEHTDDLIEAKKKINAYLSNHS